MDSNIPDDIPSSEITDPQTFFNRRNFLRGVLAATAVATGVVYHVLNNHTPRVSTMPPPPLDNLAGGVPASQPAFVPALADGETRTSYEAITNYNNFYEFDSESKEGVAPRARDFAVGDWKIEVAGLCRKPTVFDIDDLRKISPAEERVYRMRCVEAWSMVVPWNGFSLSKLLDLVEPLSSAKYVAFQTLRDPTRFPNQRPGVLPWPYVEGLRMDEAMHPLAMLVTGLYGRQLPAQDGAPVRLATPWKYGFKGAKSLVKIELVAEQPPSTWNIEAPNEYGFYANVNPNVDHPRWSQANETRIIGPGKSRSQPTLMFNGYGEQVASLYTGMDLRKYF